MADKLQAGGAPGRSRVVLNDPQDVRYWVERFGVTEDELRKAVEQVGTSVEAVARQLERNWLP